MNSTSLNLRVNDFRWRLKNKEIVPIVIGGMGVDISSDKLALIAARMGGIGHISDAMVTAVSDKHYKTQFSKIKYKKNESNRFAFDKSGVYFDMNHLKEATQKYVESTMSAKKGPGLVFVNCMEKLTMNNPLETLKIRLNSAIDSGIDGITLSAGLHLSSLSLIEDNPRFKDDVLIGIIVSSVRALKIFLSRAKRVNRMPDYIVVEGPLAGGHLGFGANWKEFQLKTIFTEVLEFLRKEDLKIAVIPAGGIFTGSDGVDYLSQGASAVQVATRFTITKECGLPERVKQCYFAAKEEDVEVSMISPTGYPMRILNNSPGLNLNIKPNCETYGFLLDSRGQCAYIDAYKKAEATHEQTKKPLKVEDKVCLCTHMRNYKIWTCGHYVYRLKDTSILLDDGNYQILDAEHVFLDYQFSNDHKISLPEKTLITGTQV